MINKNLIKRHYNCISTNYLISSYINKIGCYGQVYIIIDHASGVVIGHDYSYLPFSVETVIKTNLAVQKEGAFLPPFRIRHTSNQFLFTNKQYTEAMQAKGVQVSRGAAKDFESQVVKSFNRTFKKALKEKIAENVKLKTGENVCIKVAEAFKKRELTLELMSKLVKQVIEEYNNRKDSKLQDITPNQMEEALFLKHQNQHPQGAFLGGTNEAHNLRITRTGDIQDSFANAYKAKVIAEYKGDWLRFLLDSKKQQEEQGKAIMESVEESKDIIKKSKDIIIQELKGRAKKENERAQIEAERAQALDQKYESLFEKFLEIQKQITFLHEQEEQRQQEEEVKQLKKQKKKQAKRQPVRETVSIEEFHGIIKNCIKSQNSYVKARRIVAITLLYLTGLKVGNLLLLETGQLLELLNKGHTERRLIQRGAARHPIRLAHKGKVLLQTFKNEVHLITQNKTHGQPAFTAQNNKNKALNDNVHERELNYILVRASEIYKKHLRTHSFRASFVSDLKAKGVPIQGIQEIVGHKKLESTLIYNRRRLTIKEIDKFVSERYKIKT